MIKLGEISTCTVLGPKQCRSTSSSNFHNLPNVEAPIQAVERLAFEKCDPGGKGLAATVELRSSLDALNDTLQSRNKLLDELRSDPSLKDYDVLMSYFGLRDPEGRRIDERYKAMVDALDLQTNDAIFLLANSQRNVSEVQIFVPRSIAGDIGFPTNDWNRPTGRKRSMKSLSRTIKITWGGSVVSESMSRRGGAKF